MKHLQNLNIKWKDNADIIVQLFHNSAAPEPTVHYHYVTVQLISVESLKSWDRLLL